MVRPNFFIVGAPKCGTTAMYQYLNAHPEIFMPDLKEPNYFSKQEPEDLSRYLAIFSGAQNENMVGEASTGYLHSNIAAQRIKEFDPSAKIIIMLRSPVDLLYSAYHQSRSSGTEDLPTFEAALNDGDNRRHGKRLPGGVPKPIYRNYVQFAESVQRYFDLFGRERVHVIIYDDFQHDVASVYRQTLEFLGVDPRFQPEFSVVNASKQVRSVALQKALLFFRISPKQIKSHRLRVLTQLVPQPIRQQFSKKLRSIYLVEKRPPPMNLELRRQLQNEYMPEVQRLSALLGRDLTHWCQD